MIRSALDLAHAAAHQTVARQAAAHPLVLPRLAIGKHLKAVAGALAGLALLLGGAPARAGYQLATIAAQLSHPWDVAFLPDGDLLLTERTGTLRRISPDGTVGAPITGAPPVYFAGQGGLFEVMLDPDFATNQLIYLSYAGGTPEANAPHVARARLVQDALEDVQVIFSGSPTRATPQHYGGRMAFLPDGTLLLTTGDGFIYREAAQDRQSQLGKVLRIRTDGSLPPDNPFADDPAAAAVWSYGHRNPQGLVVDPVTGVVYEHEHGPRGGDEVNRIEPGKNYGWPAATFGIDYTGARISPYTELPGMVAPLKYWAPSIAPSGLAIYHGSAFPEWEGSLLVGALVDREVRRLTLTDGAITGEEALFSELGERIRTVEVSPDGLVYVITDGPKGSLVRVSPATTQPADD